MTEKERAEFLAREKQLEAAGVDEDKLLELGLAIVPISEVRDEIHAEALHDCSAD